MKNWSTKEMHSKLTIAKSSDNDSMLKSSGIQAFAIGECNSHVMLTHVFW